MKFIKMTSGNKTIVDDDDFYIFGSLVISETHDGYASIKGSTRLRLHRLIVEAPVGCHVDHINGDKLDNRKQNLRICNASQNAANSKLSKNNTSGYKGVTWNKKRSMWQAQIMVNRKNINLGCFTSAKTAHTAYLLAAHKHFGEFARAS